METANYLKHHGVDVITFADSPSGRTRAASILMSLKVKNETGIRVMPHICCRDSNAIGLTSKLLGAYINNIKNFLIITGDPVPSTAREQVKSVFNFDSTKLMRIVERLNDDNFPNDRICFGGALGYDKPNLEVELKRAKLKEEMGAQFFLSQPVYDKADVDKLRYMKSQLKAKVLVGIMPLVSYTNANFIKNEITGIRVPDSVLARFTPEMSREESRKIGIEICRDMMREADDFADGYYFTIPFNRLAIAKELLKDLDK
jgi:homocysteine S-methyltransferase